MNEIENMLTKQFLLRVRQEGYSIVENPSRSQGGINIDIYRGKTKICTFDDRQLGERCHLPTIVWFIALSALTRRQQTAKIMRIGTPRLRGAECFSDAEPRKK